MTSATAKNIEDSMSGNFHKEEIVEVLQTSGGDGDVKAVKSLPLPVGKSVNCLFCYSPVREYNINQAKFERKMMVKTSERLFLYICNHLDIDMTLADIQKKSKDQCILRPGNLPLCIRCKSIYYHKMYDAFVEYEVAMDKLAEQISACITKAIATSAKQHSTSVEGGEGDKLGEHKDLDSMITFQEASMNEHEVMKLVKKFRKRVADKNPTGYGELTGRQTQECQSSTSNSKQVPNSNNVTNKQPPSQQGLKNVIHIVKSTRAEDLVRTPEDRQKDMDEHLREVKKELEGEIPVASTSSKIKPFQYYAVANPSPGVIQIIPVSEDGKQGSKRKRREPEYIERKLQKLTCKFCSKVLANETSFTRHMVLEHGQEKPHKCPQCDFRTIEKASLQGHMQTHLPEEVRGKPFTCQECGKCFRIKATLRKHMASHSGNVRTFICEVCGKQFKDSKSRDYCLDKHNGVKKYECPFSNCGKRFLRREVLKIHERTHTGEKPYECNVCGKRFSQHSPLKIHLKNVHNVK